MASYPPQQQQQQPGGTYGTPGAYGVPPGAGQAQAQQPVYEKQPQMQVQPGAAQAPEGHVHVQGTAPRNWSTGLCECDFGGFLKSCCCPCISYGENYERLSSLSKTGRPAADPSCGTMGWAFCAVHCFTGCAWILDLIQRGNLRERYNIQGSGGADCCTSFCCLPCSLEQQKRELQREEAMFTGQQQPAAQGGKVH
ncbi:hypothetical protein ACM66B_003405 [Microbotryomycetes sp. NB124-2]